MSHPDSKETKKKMMMTTTTRKKEENDRVVGKTAPLDEIELWRSVADSWKRVQRGAEKNLLRADLTVAELRILRVLREHGSSPMNRFCPETMLSQPTITGIVDKLEERDLVERVRNPEDRREVLIAMTSKGNDAFKRGEELHKRFVERSLSAMNEEEAITLVRLLRKLADASESLNPTG